MTTLYAEINGKWRKMSTTIPTIECTETNVELGVTPLNSAGCEFTIPIDESTGRAIERALLPRGYRNMEILKRDGYLSPSNADMG